jgi:hypothetical protein
MPKWKCGVTTTLYRVVWYKELFPIIDPDSSSNKVVAGLFVYPGEWRQKGKADPAHNMKAFSGIWGITPLILYLSTRDKQWPSCPGHFNLRKEPWYPFSRRLGGLQSWYEWFWRKENLLPCQDSNPEPSSPQLMTILSTLLSHYNITFHRTSIFMDFTHTHTHTTTNT